MTNRSASVEVPQRMRRLPVNKAGYVVPWFVAKIDDEWDFRVVRENGIVDAHRFHLCFLCGETLGRWGTFAIGPMCAINLTSAEPPSHADCARYAVRVCPFLTTPKMIRRESMEELGEKVGGSAPAGTAIERNPGVTLLWTTRKWSTFRARGGFLFDIGEPTNVEWYAEGRPATRDEVKASIDSGLPILRNQAEEEDADTPAYRRGAVAELEKRTAAAEALLPQ